METTTSFRTRHRNDRGIVTDGEIKKVCGTCGLLFVEYAAAGRVHELHGTCPRCGERDDIGDRHDA